MVEKKLLQNHRNLKRAAKPPRPVRSKTCLKEIMLKLALCTLKRSNKNLPFAAIKLISYREIRCWIRRSDCFWKHSRIVNWPFFGFGGSEKIHCKRASQRSLHKKESSCSLLQKRQCILKIFWDNTPMFKKYHQSVIIVTKSLQMARRVSCSSTARTRVRFATCRTTRQAPGLIGASQVLALLAKDLCHFCRSKRVGWVVP